MNACEVTELAVGLMRQHGLTDWRFRFDRARRRCGVCDYRTKTIALSAVLLPKMSDSVVKDTILHEIAHALAGHQSGHNFYWKAVARSIGCTATRCIDGIEVSHTFLGTCPQCAKTWNRFRRCRGAMCPRCHVTITWTRKG